MRAWMWVLVALVPTMVVLLFPRAEAIGPTMAIGGFLVVIASMLICLFKRYPAGPFTLWSRPKEYLETKFSKSELLIFRTGALIAIAGLLAIAALAFASA